MAQVTEKEIDNLVTENQKRYDEIYGTYDPITGEGCYNFENRVLIELDDFFIPKMWVPKKTAKSVLYRGLRKMGSLKDYNKYVLHKKDDAQHFKTLTFAICRTRFMEDPEFALYMTDKIEDKVTGDMIPFKLNYPQRLLLKIFEDLRTNRKAIRVVILKAR